MTFRVNADGFITSTTSGREIIGSQVKSELNLLDFVVIKRENRSRKPKYGIYGGKFQERALVRTTYGDEVLNPDIVTPVLPSNTMLDDMVSKVMEFMPTVPHNRRIKFLYNYIFWKYPDRYVEFDVPVCSMCGAEFPERMYDGQPICEHCYRNQFINCSRCNSTVERSRAVNGLCEHCAQYHYVTRYHSNVPPLHFFGDTHNNQFPYLGVELEVAYGGESDDTVAEILPLINTDNNIFMYCSHDSSLDNGFENITMPATLEYHMSIKDRYQAVFNKLREKDYLSHDTPCCGMHVHFNRSFYDDDEDFADACIARLCYMFEKFWRELLIFSRRGRKSQIRQYCRKIDVDISTFINSSDKSDNHNWRYYALNLINEDTIEFRLFRGTLNIETFFATLELVNNMVLWSRNKTTDEVHSMQFADLLNTDTLRDYWKRITSCTIEM